jgi:uncharacterized protein with ACT and thioredoxin-like domain
VASGKLALLIQGEDQPGVLYQLTRVIASHQANITTIDIIGKLWEARAFILNCRMWWILVSS